MRSTHGLPTREAYGKALVELGARHPNLYVIDADIGRSCKTTEFMHMYPDQYVNVGIAEQNAAGVAAGLATCGKLPFITTYAVFGSMRMLEQVRQEICYPNLNVKIACSHGGLTPANDGASHQGIEDLGIYRTIPQMTVVAPADYYSAYALTIAAAERHIGPLYIRFTRDATPFIYQPEDTFEIGKTKILSEGDDITIISSGVVLSIALKAKEELQRKGISVRLIDMHTIKPLDIVAVENSIATTKGIITIEDHSIYNGLGSAVSEIVAQKGKSKVAIIGIRDRFGESAPYERLLAKNDITVEEIINQAGQLLGKEIKE
jgi:transketolase